MRSGPVVLGFAAFAIVLDRWPEYRRRPDAHPAVGGVPLLRDDRGRDQHRLGPRRHAHPRPGCVLRARRVLRWACTSRSSRFPTARCRSSCRSTATTRTLPWLWQPFKYLWFAAPAAVLVSDARRRRPRVARVQSTDPRRRTSPSSRRPPRSCSGSSLVGQLQLTAGTNGLTNFSTVFGRSKYAPGTNEFLFGLAAVGLFVTLVIARQVVKSRYGRLLVATRDGEDRVRFLGYDPAVTKTFAFASVGGNGGARRRARARRSSASWHPTSSRCCRRSSWSRGSRSADARRSTAR